MQIEINHTPVFDMNWPYLHDDNVRYIVNQGGSRSSKTYSILQCLIVMALQKKLEISIVRKSFPSLRTSVYRTFLTILNDIGIYNEKNHNKTNSIYRFPNGSIIEFFSIDNAQKVRGSSRDICYCNEGNELILDDFYQLAMRTRIKLVIDFNPSESESWIYDVLGRENSVLIKSTYKDNTFLTEENKKEIEDLISVDENYYKIYALGEKPVSNAQVYTHFKRTNRFPDDAGFIFYGLDFGYNDPCVLVKCVKTDNGEIYCKEELYQSKLTTTELIELLKQKEINGTIWADSSRPEIIKEIRTAGFDCKPAIKNIFDGIMTLKSNKILITNSSVNAWDEVSKYHYKTNKRGDILNEPIDLHNHFLDALRYAVYSTKSSGFDENLIISKEIDLGEYKPVNW